MPTSEDTKNAIVKALQEQGVTIETGDIEIGAVELKDATTTTRAKIKTDGTDNALVVMQNVAPPAPTGSATAANQATIITALQLIDDLQKALKSVDTDELICRITTSAGVEIDPATEGKQDNMITALQLIDNLVGALKSVDTDELITRITDSAGVEINPAKEDGNLASVKTNTATPTSIGDGSKTVTVAGTAEALAGSTTCKTVTIQAMLNNTNKIYIGGSTVDNTRGIALQAGDIHIIEIDNLNKIYIDVDTSGEGVTYNYVA